MCYTFISCILLLALMCLKLAQSDLELLNIMNLDFRKTCCGSILIGFRAEGKRGGKEKKKRKVEGDHKKGHQLTTKFFQENCFNNKKVVAQRFIKA